MDYRYVDRDGAVSNGCECGAANGVDVPDTYASYPQAGAAFVDRDCDGVDGVASRALFVRAGAGPGDGRRETPFASIRLAIQQFRSDRHDAILVAAGLYTEAIELRNGVALYGGYSADFLERDVAGQPSIIAPSRPTGAGAPMAAVTARGDISAALAGFVVQAWDGASGATFGQNGQSSVAVLLDGVGRQVVVQNNEIRAGRGGDGAPGRAGQGGGDGGDGGDGADSSECATTSCAGESVAGGIAGRNGQCVGAAGRSGGRARGGDSLQDYQPPLGLDGLGGDNARYSSANNP
ncbi:MAG: hypothetical protein AAGK78_16470, partial [Planctomycetota bacterium]